MLTSRKLVNYIVIFMKNTHCGHEIFNVYLDNNGF